MPGHDHLPLDELQRLAKAIAQERVWLRYHAVILAAQGRSAAGVALALGCGVDARRIREREFGVLLGLQAVYDLLHRHGFSGLIPRPRHKDADEEPQAIFKGVIVDRIRTIREAHPEEDVQVWFEDEARLGQRGTLARVWAREGSRPRGVRQTRYGYL